MSSRHNTGPREPEAAAETGRGVVKSVLSGDTFTIVRTDQRARNGPPPETELTLAMLEVPKLGRRNAEDEPWAWKSREFLRNLLIGKPITFTVQWKNPESNRRYSIVYLNENENVLKTVVEAGWARVRAPADGKGPRNDLHAELLAAMALAEDAKKGVFQAPSKKGAIRPVHKSINTMELLEKFGGKETNGEYIPQPFAREAKYFTETHLLNRTVKLVLLGVGKTDIFNGSISYQGRNLAEELLKVGLAKFVQWNAPRGQVEEMKACEAQAQSQRLRIWRNFVPSEDSTSTSFDAKVCEVQNRGIIQAKKTGSQEAVVLHLSSVNVPSMGSFGNRKDDEPLSWEAREFIRAKLIGKRVSVTLDYKRDAMTTRDGREVAERSFYSVVEGGRNIALQLVEAGLAKVQSHFDGNRSPIYQDLVMAEKHAKSKTCRGFRSSALTASQSKGLWRFDSEGKTSSGEKYSFKLNDLTVREKKEDKDAKTDNKKARQLLPFLQRAGKVSAVVEYVMSSAKLKIRIPREGCMIFFSLEAVRTPRQEEEYGDEALDFVRSRLHQRDVDIVVSSLDKGGNFLGMLWLEKKNFVCKFLESGLARLLTQAAERSAFRPELLAAQDVAKTKKRKLWKNYDEAAEQAAREARRAERAAQDSDRQQNREIIQVTVTEIFGGGRFYAQNVDEAGTLSNLMATINASEPGPHESFRGPIGLCKFSDGQWYRVRVPSRRNQEEPLVNVLYIDYGNTATVPYSSIRPCPEEAASQAPLALECVLAFLRVPEVDDDFGEDAGLALRELMWDKVLAANIEAREGQLLHLSIGDPQSQDLVNVAMVKHGFATIQRRSLGYNPALLQVLRTEQEKARTSRAGMWVYGDIPDEELDERR